MQIRTIVAGFVLASAGAYAQGPGPGPGGPFGGGPGARFLGAEAVMSGRVVKNAPFSADVVTESTHALADGNKLHQTNTARVYRDSEGRTRREQSLASLGALAPSADLPSHVVFIRDPVAGANYALNATNKTATKSAWVARGGQGGPNGPMARLRGQAADGNAPMGPRGAGRARPAGQNTKTEALGTQVIEGVTATGTRTTLTIPAGQIGNDQPLQIVTERWYSADLQMDVLTKHSDPRFGDTVTRLANVTRVEPAHTLFEAPADYKVTDAVRGGRTPMQP